MNKLVVIQSVKGRAVDNRIVKVIKWKGLKHPKDFESLIKIIC